MRHSTLNLIYFSPTGGTQKVIEEIGKNLSGKITAYDLAQNPFERETAMPSGSLTVVGAPVYSGRIPPLCQQSLAHLKGNGMPAIAVAVFGNREYDDALLELKNTLEDAGFLVIAAAAFVSKHVIFPQVAAERPDAEDLRLIAGFARQCAKKLEALPETSKASLANVKGNFPYKPLSRPALRPSADQNCTLCGACVPVCPAQAISLEKKSLVQDGELCISCSACVAVCPEKAMAFRGEGYEGARTKFVEAFSRRKEPEIFL